jgi:hypothetical protein
MCDPGLGVAVPTDVEEVVEDAGFGEVLFFKPFSNYYKFMANDAPEFDPPPSPRGNTNCFYPVVFGPREVDITFWHEMYTIPLPWMLFVCYFTGKQWAVWGVQTLAERPTPGKPVKTFQSVLPNTRFLDVPCWGSTRKWSNTVSFPDGALEAIGFFMSTNFNTELGGFSSPMMHLGNFSSSDYYETVRKYSRVPLRSVTYRAKHGIGHLKIKRTTAKPYHTMLTLEAWPDEEETVSSAA